MKYAEILNEMQTEKHHEGNYSRYFVEGAKLSDIATHLENKKLPWKNDEFMCGWENEYGAGFEVQSGYPEDAQFLSKLIPDRLIIGEGCWDLNYWRWYVSEQEPKEYFTKCTKDSRADWSEAESDLFDVTIDFFNQQQKKIYSAFFGAIDAETAENMR